MLLHALCLSLLLFSLVFSTPTGNVVRKHITITDGLVQPDGYLREATLVDGKIIGTVISGKKGDKFEITVSNDLASDMMWKLTSIHWHGIHMRRSSWSDGAAFVSQCPIVPGISFKYAWDTSENGSPQAGTFWYHSHYSTQYCDGLRGPLIIRDERDRERYEYDVDDGEHTEWMPMPGNTIITLADWFHSYAKDFHPAPWTLPPFPDSILINGKGRDPLNPISDLAVVTVSPNKRYRMRVIAMACYTNFEYSIDGHRLSIIEADSTLVEPYEVDSLYVYAGQRYSHILDTRNKRPDAYWIRAQPERLAMKYLIRDYTGANETFPYWTNDTNVAILRYTNSPNLFPPRPSDEEFPSPSSDPDVHSEPFNESNLVPLHRREAPGIPEIGRADINLVLTSVMDFEMGVWVVNSGSFVSPPEVPILLQIMSGRMNANDLMPTGSVIPLPRDKVVEVRIKGTSKETGGPHPWHLHGHDFYVIKPVGASEPNFKSPLVRDTVSSGIEGEEVIIRFVTDNPGPWFLHCHLDWHLEMGMGVVMAEDVPSISKQRVPEEWYDLCKQYDSYVADALIDFEGGGRVLLDRLGSQ